MSDIAYNPGFGFDFDPVAAYAKLREAAANFLSTMIPLSAGEGIGDSESSMQIALAKEDPAEAERQRQIEEAAKQERLRKLQEALNDANCPHGHNRSGCPVCQSKQ